MVEIYQQISKKLPKLAVIAATAALSFTVIDAKPVKAELVWWDMEFFDNTGGQVGSGEFSYDLDTTTFIETVPYDCGEDPWCGFFVNTAVENLSANVLGMRWEWKGPYGKWWLTDDPKATREAQGSRYGIFQQSQWAFGDTFLYNEYFIMSGTSTSSTGGGSWFQDGPSLPEWKKGSGSWTATLRNSTSIPEPTVTLSLFGFATLGLASLKKHKQQ